MECIILTVKENYMDGKEDALMDKYGKITALYSRLSVGDEDRDGGESNSIQNQKIFLEGYAKQQRLTNIRHYIDDDESGRFFDRSGYAQISSAGEENLFSYGFTLVLLLALDVMEEAKLLTGE
jgi:site-specific DNA recombinase